MSKNTLDTSERQLLESIIYTFHSRFICTIKHHVNSLFDMAQLSSCLLEHLSGFLYGGPVGERTNRFIYAYMESYSQIDLFDVLRNTLCEDKLAESLASVMSDVPGRLLNGKIGPNEEIIMKLFGDDLKTAVEAATNDLRHDKSKRKHALLWVRDHPVFEFPYSLYTSDEQGKLASYYTRCLKKSGILPFDHPLSFGFNFGDGGYFISVMIDNYGGRKDTTRVPLEFFIELLRLMRPEDVLEQEDEA